MNDQIRVDCDKPVSASGNPDGACMLEIHQQYQKKLSTQELLNLDKSLVDNKILPAVTIGDILHHTPGSAHAPDLIDKHFKNPIGAFHAKEQKPNDKK